MPEIDVVTPGDPNLNHDISIPTATLESYPLLKPILAYPPLEKKFAQVDRIALRRKKGFVVLGTLSLVFVCFVLILLVVQIALSTLTLSLPFGIEVAGAVLGIVAVAIQLFLFLSQLQERWLFARYSAERIRLWKFQLFLDGAFISLF